MTTNRTTCVLRLSGATGPVSDIAGSLLIPGSLLPARRADPGSLRSCRRGAPWWGAGSASRPGQHCSPENSTDPAGRGGARLLASWSEPHRRYHPSVICATSSSTSKSWPDMPTTPTRSGWPPGFRLGMLVGRRRGTQRSAGAEEDLSRLGGAATGRRGGAAGAVDRRAPSRAG